MGSLTLAPDELTRYARHIVLREIGGAGQRRLKDATAAVIGVGGIGSPALQYLAGAGVGRLILVDDDRVEVSNLQRQTIFDSDDVGSLKAESAATAIRALNPFVETICHSLRLDARNVDHLIGEAAVVIDGTDNFTTRLVAADAALAARVPLVSAAVGQFEGQIAVYRGWEAGKPCYRCLVGDSPDHGGGTCADDGILGPVTGIVGSIAALEAVRAIVPFGEDPAGRLLLMDFLDGRFRSVRVAADPACRSCSNIK